MLLLQWGMRGGSLFRALRVGENAVFVSRTLVFRSDGSWIACLFIWIPHPAHLWFIFLLFSVAVHANRLTIGYLCFSSCVICVDGVACFHRCGERQREWRRGEKEGGESRQKATADQRQTEISDKRKSGNRCDLPAVSRTKASSRRPCRREEI